MNIQFSSMLMSVLRLLLLISMLNVFIIPSLLYASDRVGVTQTVSDNGDFISTRIETDEGVVSINDFNGDGDFNDDNEQTLTRENDDDSDSDTPSTPGNGSRPALDTFTLTANKTQIYPNEPVSLTYRTSEGVHECSKWSRVTGTNEQSGFGGWSSGSNYFTPVRTQTTSHINTTPGNYTFAMSCRMVVSWNQPNDNGNYTNPTRNRVTRTVTVRVIPRPVPAATIAAPNCTIPVNGATCPITISWNISNATTPNVYNQTRQTSYGTIAVNPGSQVSLTHGPNTIQARSSSTVITTVTPRATCATGSTWNGARCLMPNPNADIVAPDCTIPVNGATCPININWTIRNAQNPNVYNQTRQTSYGTIAVNPGSQVSLAHGPNTIVARSGTQVLESIVADATCIDGTAWNGTLCARIVPTATIAATPCVITTGSSTCLSRMTWDINNATEPNVRNRTRDVIHSIEPTAQNLPRSITFGANTIEARNGTTILASTTARATCATDATWNGTRCLKTGDPDGTLTGTSCFVTLGDSTCQGTLTWNVDNSVDPRLVRMGDGSVNTAIATIPSGTRPVTLNPSTLNSYQLRDTGMASVNLGLRARCALVNGVTPTVQGGVCALPPVTDSGLAAEDCFISNGNNTCQSRMSWDFINLRTANPRVVNETTGEPYTVNVNRPKVTRLGQEIIRGVNTIQSYDGNRLLDTVPVTGRCAPGTRWDTTRGICYSATACPSGDPSCTPPPCTGPSCPVATSTDPTAPPIIRLTASSTLVRSGERAPINWTISTIPPGYTCNLTGPGIGTRLITTTRGTTLTDPIENKSLFVLTCTGAETVRAEIAIEVVPTVVEV